MIHTNDDLTARFAATARREQAELDMALLVSELLRGDQQAKTDYLRFTESLHRDVASDVYVVLDWFTTRGFPDTTEREVTLAHSDLAWVIEQRAGIPISLSALLIETARRLGRRSFGVNYPGYFLMVIDEQLIDPLKFQVMSSDEVPKSANSTVLSPVNTATFGLRMLNNVKNQLGQQQQWHLALEVIDVQQAMAGEDRGLQASLAFEAGQYWQQLGSHGFAREAYLRAAELAGDQALQFKAYQEAQALEDSADTWH